MMEDQKKDKELKNKKVDEELVDEVVGGVDMDDYLMS